MATYPLSGLTSASAPFVPAYLSDAGPGYYTAVAGEESLSIPIVRLGANGGIGFQYTGGIITIDASSGEIDVSFDRPMTYQGGLVDPPAGVGWYFEGYPFLLDGARALHLPVKGSGQPPGPLSGSSTTDPAPLAPSGAAQGDAPPRPPQGFATTP